MNKTLRSLVFAGLAAASVSVFAQQSGSVKIDFLGPGGHSSNNYGRTSALHAAGRTAIQIQKTLPAGSYVIMNLTGGNSVNSIASDGLIEIRLTAANATAYQALVTAVTDAANVGAAAENAFRNVKVGDLTAGVPAWIRTTVTPL
jgi:metal-dependent amidase/aminoacylase/carboxypeptidase family protein